ncbi:mitochondrial processing peptidase [Pseudozyma hubeiensis SY62]|uniref:Mitochondrial processing peptidase n=1 Tax=Pseudozyma hubeiensis (strain SY62) TaxID=1305764 RepID=R9P069_PSEHS|nr:mitochondrial processing peptidase [Pseudozyma hubeiensis SY62]GAC94583.1 mitochondrial processing peptidase [Pseudozyma hubeiensis SY62]
METMQETPSLNPNSAETLGASLNGMDKLVRAGKSEREMKERGHLHKGTPCAARLELPQSGKETSSTEEAIADLDSDAPWCWLRANRTSSDESKSRAKTSDQERTAVAFSEKPHLPRTHSIRIERYSPSSHLATVSQYVTCWRSAFRR